MNLVDIVNKIPVAIAFKIVEKTGKSQYTLAQICNFTGSLPAAYLAMDSYHNGFMPGVLVGGIFMVIHSAYIGLNSTSKNLNDPNYMKKSMEKISERYGDFTRMDKEDYITKRKEIIVDSEKKFSSRLGLSTLMFSVVFAASSGLAYALPDSPEESCKICLYFAAASASLLLGSLACYFRAIPDKK